MDSSTKKPTSQRRQTAKHKQALFETVAQVQAFVAWAKAIGLKRAKIGDVELELSDLALLPLASETGPKGTEERDTSKTLTDTLTPDAKQEDEDLFWSSNS